MASGAKLAWFTAGTIIFPNTSQAAGNGALQDHVRYSGLSTSISWCWCRDDLTRDRILILGDVGGARPSSSTAFNASIFYGSGSMSSCTSSKIVSNPHPCGEEKVPGTSKNPGFKASPSPLVEASVSRRVVDPQRYYQSFNLLGHNSDISRTQGIERAGSPMCTGLSKRAL